MREGGAYGYRPGRGDRKGWGRKRGEGRDEDLLPRGGRCSRPSLLTFALGMRVFAVERGTGMLGERGTRAPGAAGRWPVIAMRYGGHFSLK